jgi:hypothetical protein
MMSSFVLISIGCTKKTTARLLAYGKPGFSSRDIAVSQNFVWPLSESLDIISPLPSDIVFFDNDPAWVAFQQSRALCALVKPNDHAFRIVVPFASRLKLFANGLIPDNIKRDPSLAIEFFRNKMKVTSSPVECCNGCSDPLLLLDLTNIAYRLLQCIDLPRLASCYSIVSRIAGLKRVPESKTLPLKALIARWPTLLTKLPGKRKLFTNNFMALACLTLIGSGLFCATAVDDEGKPGISLTCDHDLRSLLKLAEEGRIDHRMLFFCNAPFRDLLLQLNEESMLPGFASETSVDADVLSQEHVPTAPDEVKFADQPVSPASGQRRGRSASPKPVTAAKLVARARSHSPAASGSRSRTSARDKFIAETTQCVLEKVIRPFDKLERRLQVESRYPQLVEEVVQLRMSSTPITVEQILSLPGLKAINTGRFSKLSLAKMALIRSLTEFLIPNADSARNAMDTS